MTDALPEFTIAELEGQKRADFDAFTRDDAARLGETTVEVIRERGLSLAVDIHIDDELAFRAQLANTGQANADAIAGKIRTVRHFAEPSLLTRLKAEAQPAIADGLDDSLKLWGGSIPIFVNGELIGTISVSGEPDVVDHSVASQALERFASATAPRRMLHPNRTVDGAK